MSNPFDFIKSINQGKDIMTDAIEEHQFQQLVVRQAFGTGGEEPFAQPLPVAVIMRLVGCRSGDAVMPGSDLRQAGRLRSRQSLSQQPRRVLACEYPRFLQTVPASAKLAHQRAMRVRVAGHVEAALAVDILALGDGQAQASEDGGGFGVELDGGRRGRRLRG